MSQELHIVAAVIGGIVANVFLDVLGLSGPPAWAVVIAAAVGLWALYLYSPLPNRTLGPMGGDSGAGYWGFSRSE